MTYDSWVVILFLLLALMEALLQSHFKTGLIYYGSYRRKKLKKEQRRDIYLQKEKCLERRVKNLQCAVGDRKI